MEHNHVCFPGRLGCFTLPTGGSPVIEEDNAGEDYADEFILSDASAAANLRMHDPPGCFLCIADTIGDED